MCPLPGRKAPVGGGAECILAGLKLDNKEGSEWSSIFSSFLGVVFQCAPVRVSLFSLKILGSDKMHIHRRPPESYSLSCYQS